MLVAVLHLSMVALALAGGPTRPRRAMWKPNTHLFAANKALADAVADGRVTIPPFGEFTVNANALRALRGFPEAYRAGVVGPDVFPDIWVGQSLAHVDHSRDGNRWMSDDWLRRIFAAARMWRDGADRDRALAFAYGFMTHASGDMFAHTYVNHKVGGAWDWSKMHTVTAHVVLESYVGQHTPPTNMVIDVWPRFVAEALIKDATTREHTKSALHYQRLLAIYDWLGPAVERASREMSNGVPDGSPYWVKCSAHPVLCARKEQMELWKLDIDRGFRALVETNEALGDAILSGDLGDGVGAYQEWLAEWGPKMLGAHAVGEGAKAMDEFMEWVAQWDPLAPIREAIADEVMDFLKDEFPREFQLFEMMKNPASYLVQQFGRDSAQQVIADLHMGPAPDSLLDWQRFEPLYNSVIVAKLALLDGDGLNELARRAGVTTQLFPSGESVDVMLGFMRMMDGNDQWVPGSEYGLPYTPYGGDVRLAGRQLPMVVVGGRGRPTGFPLYADAVAREKIFTVIFKGYGVGPGNAPIRDDPVTIVRIAPGTDGRRAFASASDQLERMRDLVAIVQARFGGRPTMAPALAPGRLPVTPGAPRGAAPAAPTTWAQQNCAREVGELRDAIGQLQRATTRLRASRTLLGVSGRAGMLAQQLDAPGRELAARLDRFAAAPDAGAAATALRAFTEQLDAVTRTAGVR